MVKLPVKPNRSNGAESAVDLSAEPALYVVRKSFDFFSTQAFLKPGHLAFALGDDFVDVSFR